MTERPTRRAVLALSLVLWLCGCAGPTSHTIVTRSVALAPGPQPVVAVLAHHFLGCENINKRRVAEYEILLFDLENAGLNLRWVGPAPAQMTRLWSVSGGRCPIVRLSRKRYAPIQLFSPLCDSRTDPVDHVLSTPAHTLYMARDLLAVPPGRQQPRWRLLVDKGIGSGCEDLGFWYRRSAIALSPDEKTIAVVPAPQQCGEAVVTESLLLSDDGQPLRASVPIRRPGEAAPLYNDVGFHYEEHNPVLPLAVRNDGTVLMVEPPTYTQGDPGLFLIRPNGHGERFPIDATYFIRIWPVGSGWVLNRYNEQLHALDAQGNLGKSRELKLHYWLHVATATPEELLVPWYDDSSGQLCVFTLNEKLPRVAQRCIDLWSVMPEPKDWTDGR